ncbi:unnamed protein product [Ostreobium quekettii]|uniref:Uncharacterized protein n=1 Tax=Ostreobium quekettii TaxID=121088 RepID=A0A8S1J0E3_9CHLO|nr:unnamed protein product [Ostreobium quekettii]|eukprot:evm.model.scf_122.18 EVM.evm.TU.scf_122.18   scf_122:135513-143009(+)
MRRHIPDLLQVVRTSMLARPPSRLLAQSLATTFGAVRLLPPSGPPAGEPPHGRRWQGPPAASRQRERSWRAWRSGWSRCDCLARDIPAQSSVKEAAVGVDVLVEGKPLSGDWDNVESIDAQLREDGVKIVRQALALDPATSCISKESVELSLVLCDDDHMQQTNLEWRQVDSPTDVLSFPMMDDEDLITEALPVLVLGDVMISLDTARRQAHERGHDLVTECRILLVHGVLHLLGHDHDRGDEEWEAMAQQEQRVLEALGWQGKGLISALGNSMHSGLLAEEVDAGSETGAQGDFSTGPVVSKRSSRQIELIALDMDGTLLDSKSKILESSREAIMLALNKGVSIVLATGKARPAAIEACAAAKLSGENGIVSAKSPGVFLQGLAVYSTKGQLLPGPSLPKDVLSSAFQYAVDNDVACVGFLGDTCVTLDMKEEVKTLHSVYYEPLAKVASHPDEIVDGPPLKKLIFLADAQRIEEAVKPKWQESVKGRGAAVMQAVPIMLEIVPEGVNKWEGMKGLLQEMAFPAEAVMAIGDGGNDFEMVQGAGLGVAMGNAVQKVKQVADVVVATNDEDGVAEAIERFVL